MKRRQAQPRGLTMWCSRYNYYNQYPRGGVITGGGGGAGVGGAGGSAQNVGGFGNVATGGAGGASLQ